MENLKRLRKNLTKSQQDVAEALGVTNQTYSNYETGQRKPDPAMLVKLANYFGVSVDYLLGNSPEPRYYPADLILAPDEYLTIGSDGKKEIHKLTPELKAYMEFLKSKK
ncbi:MAG: helix-turn-helix domain-containing protein [Firmicutes bacterium]|nr:helix-turn-helix domain-containing protein [Bacillota bacterium]